MTARVGVAIAAVCIVVSSASAQSKNAQAETLFRQARELMAQKKYAEACAAFESSQKLDPAAGTQFSVGVCNELGGKLATAWGVFIDFERAYRGSTDPVAKELLPKARDRAAKLEPRLSKLTITVAQAKPGLSISLDGQDVDAGAWNHALPIDGGEHVIVARLAKHEDSTQKVTVGAEKDSQTITIGELVLLPDAPPTPTPTPVPVEPVDKPEPTKAERSLVVPIAFAGGAVVLGGAALGLELWGRNMHDDAQATLDDGNASRAKELQDGANMRRYIAQGLGIAAIGCAGVSIFLFLRSPSEPRDRNALRVVPTASRDQAGVSIGGAW